MGGIASPDDALEFMLSGSSAVQIGTANFHDPGIGLRIVRGMEGWCRREGVRAIREIVGTLRLPSRTVPQA
jgi:dihydroorotate dehydrogenase (NAD+) catalytic subunit